MRFEWDPAKNEVNVRERGIDFADAASIFDGPMFTWVDLRRDYGEPRMAGLGLLNGRVMAFAFTMRGSDVVRWISVRKANAREAARFRDWAKQKDDEGEGDPR